MSPSCMDEKYWIVSLVEECLIDERDLDFTFPEKSSAYRDTDTFFFWFFLDLLWYKEKSNIWDL